jgi:DNA-binding NtrC family response regulator
MTAPPPVAALLRSLLEGKTYRKEFELLLMPLLSGSPDWGGARWFQPCEGVRCLVVASGGTSGTPFLVCVPLVHQEETEDTDRSRLLALLRTLKNPEAKSVVDFAPILSHVMRRKLQTHLISLAKEMDLAFSKRTRRSGDTPRLAGTAFSGLVGDSPAADELRQRVKALATTELPVLLSGEVGTGRRTAARAIHVFGPRRAHPWVVVDCQTTPPSQIVASCLGERWRLGQVSEIEKISAGGTVLFHEITYLPALVQQFLLYYLDTWVTRAAPPFRLLATTSLPATALDANGALRPELVSLLRSNSIRLLPLRERKMDVPPLVSDMLLQIRSQEPDLPAEVRRDVVKALQACEWPGNMWELKGEVRHMASAARGRPEITLQDVSARILATLRRPEPSSAQMPERALSLPEAVENLERSLLSETLMATKWNRSRTAKVLGISRRNLIRKISAYKLDRRKRTEMDTDSEKKD